MSIATDKALNLGGAKILYNDLRGRIDGKDVTAPIAPSDTATATEAHAVGDVISVGGQLYVVTAAIAIGDTIAEGTNVESTTVMAQMAKKVSESDLLSLYTGVAEYTPAAEASFAPGIFYRQVGAKYIGMLKGDSSLTINLNSGTYQIPNESDNDWDIMYFGDPGLKEAMIFPLPGITEYTPASTYELYAGNVYHEVGSKYVVMTNDNTLKNFSASGFPAGTGPISGGVTEGVCHLPTESDENFNVYTIGGFLSAWYAGRVSKRSPEINSSLSIRGAELSRAQLLTLLGLINNNGTYNTPPTTIKLGSTTITEAQLQALLATLN